MCITQKELKEYARLKQQVDILRLQHKEILAEIKLVNELSGMPHGSGVFKPAENAAIRLLEVSDKLVETINRKTDLFLRIEREIRKLPLKEYAVIHRHYILCESWEAIAEKLNYSERHILRIHSNALKLLVKQ